MVNGGTWNAQSGVGGFHADLDIGPTIGAADDAIAWRLDAVLTD